MTVKKKTTKRAPKKPTKTAANPKVPKASSKMSAVDSAAHVLAGSKEPLNVKQMIDAMRAKGLWKSPNGKTPWATLYSAILREISAKGKGARFKKTGRGKFALNG